MGIIAKLFGNPNTDIISSKIDDIITKLPAKEPEQNFDNLVGDSLKNILSVTDPSDDKEIKKSNANLNEIEKLFEGIQLPDNRVKRYDVYDDIYKTIQLIKRIVKVYISNIFQKDTISNTMMLIKETDLAKNYDKILQVKQLTKNIIKYFKLEDKLKHNTAFNMLKYGDAFIEIVDLNDVKTKYPIITKKDDKDDKVITEVYNQLSSKNPYRNEISNRIYDDFVDVLFEFDDDISEAYDVDINDEKILTEGFLSESGSDDQLSNTNLEQLTIQLKRLLLKFHTPHKIIVLISPYDNILGYIEVKDVARQVSSTNILKQFTSIVDKISTGKPSSETKYDDAIRDFSKLIVKKIMTKYNIVKQDKMTDVEYESKIHNVLGDDIFFSLKRIMVGSTYEGLFRKKLSIRFIQPQNMFHFKMPGSDFNPYGASLIDPLVFPGKLYLFTQLANSVYKLSRAAQIRKWNIETGSKQDHSALLQRLKRNFRNQRITASDISSSKDISQILSDFKDLVTFSKHGQKFIDVELTNLGDPNLKTNDLNDLRQEMVSLSGIPSSYLNIPEAGEVRDNLVHTNVVFATEISNIQEIINTQILALIDRVFQIIGYEELPSKFIFIQLFPPVVLMLQLIESTLVSVGNIFAVFKDVPGVTLSPVSLLKHYVPYIDWDQMLKEGEKLNMQNKVIATDQASQLTTQFSGQPNFQ